MKKIIICLCFVILVSISATWAEVEDLESLNTGVIENDLLLIREKRDPRKNAKKGTKGKRKSKNMERRGKRKDKDKKRTGKRKSKDKKRTKKNNDSKQQRKKLGKSNNRKRKERRKAKGKRRFKAKVTRTNDSRKKKKIMRKKSRTNVGEENPLSSSCSDCVKNSVSVMDTWRFQVTNFDKQWKRVEKQTSVAASKANKSSSFTELASLLGNTSCPNNMMELDNFTSILKECEMKVKDACNLTRVNMSLVEDCKMMTTSFVDEAKKCKDASRGQSKKEGKEARGAVHPDNPLSEEETTTKSSASSDACECWTNLVPKIAMVKKCRIAEAAEISAQFGVCRAAFSACKQTGDKVAEALARCGCAVTTTLGPTRRRREWTWDNLNKK